MENVLTIAIGAIKGTMSGEFSKGQTSEALRKAFIEMNGGSDKLNPKTFVRGNELYSAVEELIPTIVEEGLKDENPIFRLVEYKNIASGDVNEFYTSGEAVFIVADAAAGIRGTFGGAERHRTDQGDPAHRRRDDEDDEGSGRRDRARGHQRFARAP